ncbi:MAG: spore germination protein, partial [Bacillota bacterium]|nr:spore germination protein [Bacillota bacterium]
MNLLKKSKLRKNKITKMMDDLPKVETQSTDLIFKEDLETNLDEIKKELGNCSDLVIRNILVGNQELAIVYIEGLADSDRINKSIITPITSHMSESENIREQLLTNLCKKVITNAQIKEKFDRNELILSVLSGDTLLLVNGFTEGIVLGTK